MSRRSDEAIAAGYQDTASNISDSLDMMKFLPLEQQYQLQQSGVTKYNLELAQLQRDFVRENIDNNYEADMNQIEQSTIQLYYGLLQAEKNAKVCEETLASERRTLELVPEERKGEYTVGYSQNYIRLYVRGEIAKKARVVAAQPFEDGLLAVQEAKGETNG